MDRLLVKAVILVLQVSLVLTDCTKNYTVKQGDTCWMIWTNNGLTEKQFYDLNPGIDCDDLQPGQVICIAGTISSHTPIGSPFTGEFTYYTDIGTGYCGSNINAQTQMLVAISSSYMTTQNPSKDPRCRQCLLVQYQGKNVTVPVKDECPGCAEDHMDLSYAAFKALANPVIGICQGATFTFVTC